MTNEHGPYDDRSASSTAKWVFIAFLLVAVYFLVMEHRAHLEGVLSYLPFLLLLACPLMHLFMHHRHGHGRHGSGDASNKSTREK